jgi:FkbM family methyltransferase
MFKKILKKNSHNLFFRKLAGLARLFIRFYENSNYDQESNGESTILKKISQFNPDVIIDGGANVGNYAKLIGDLCPSSKVYCFEPVTQTFDKLKNNLINNSKIIATNKGLYSENCSKIINLFNYNEHSSIFDLNNVFEKSTNSTVVELIKGDDFLLQNNIKSVFFLKLDVEGAEYDALKGFENSLKNNLIKLIQFEYGYINIKTKHLLVDFYEFFESYGFIVGKVFPKVVEFRKYEHRYEDFIGPNFIAVHKNETELIKALENNI